MLPTRTHLPTATHPATHRGNPLVLVGCHSPTVGSASNLHSTSRVGSDPARVRSLTSALRGGGDAGQPLPTVIQQLAGLQADIRLGELTLFASAPGVGKSVIALHIAKEIRLPTLYISADTSAHTMGVRAASMLTGEMVPAVDKMMRVEPSFYDRVLQAGCGHIVFDFNTSPSVITIKEATESFAVMYGDYPHLIVVDNLRNVYSSEDDTAAQQHNTEDLKMLAAETGSAVLLLHHVTGAFEDGSITPGLGALENKCGKHPALVVTFSNGNTDLRAAVVKNRYGPASPSGRLKVFIPMNTAQMKVG